MYVTERQIRTID